MPALQPRPSLVRQTADHLRVEIARGVWRDALPGERELASTLLVGRNTLRAALRELAADGLLKSRQGVGHRILRSPSKSASACKSRSVGLLVPGGLQSLRAGQILWIDQLRALLIKQGHELILHHQNRFPRDIRRHACWVLVLCDGALQRRFARAGVPCVIAGSPHPGVVLPSVDLDHRAVCRHAVGALLSRGHRRIAFVTRKPLYAGDRESERGWIEGARLSPRADVSAQVIRHDNTRGDVIRVIQRLFRQPAPPTALLIGDPHHYATVASRLAIAGGHAPASLLCRDDDPFLAHLVPEPARYAFPPDRFAREVLKRILDAANTRPPKTLRLQPRLVQGETLARLVP